LESRGVVYAIFGVVAMTLHGLVRTTEGLDLFVRPKAENIEGLRLALHDVFDDVQIDQITTADLLGDYPSIRYTPPDGTLYIDILTRLGDAFTFDDLDVERLPVEDIHATVVTPRTLYRMKKDTLRLKDRADAFTWRTTDAGDQVPIRRGDAR
jgi:hypothetical protein